jgi:hypothetical protein
MANMADITIKKYDGTTDIVFTAMSPSAGDATPSVWRSNSVSVAAGFRPMLSLSSRFNGPKTARRVDYSFVYPETAVNSTTGLTTVVNKVVISGSFALPENTPDTTKQEAVLQCLNLLKSALISGCLIAGYAPN